MSPPPPPPSKTMATATATTAALATPSRGTEKKTTTEPNNNNNNNTARPSSSSTTTKSSLSFTSPPSRTQPSLTRIYPSSSTAPSSSSLFASSSSSESLSDISINGTGAGTAAVPASTSPTATVSTAPAAIPKIDPNEPNMYLLPGDLHRYYRPLPFLLQLGTVIVSAMMSAMATSFSTPQNLRQLSLLPLQWLRKISLSSDGGVFQQPWGKIVAFLARFLICTLVLNISIQEIFFPPSRVSMPTLLERYFLPSPLSKYRQVTLPPPPRSSSSFSTGVHYLEYHNKNLKASETEPSFDALYFQHGFGACSLSWLPAIPSLVERMKAKVAYGHDAPGFGFTDRPNHLRWYTHRASAWIAQQVMNLNHPIAATGNTNDAGAGDGAAGATAAESLKTKSKTLGLFGHSMGSLTILRLALDLPRDTSKFIVLASPALGIRGIPKKPPKVKTHDQGNRSIPYWIRQKALKPFNKALTNRVLDPCTRYVLRRAVGTQGSWRSGLKLAWGDPNKLSESDVARFSWPSIGMGWEQGIINFSRAQMSHVEDNHNDHDDEDYELDNDRILMQRVLELPNTKVVVILGSKDRVVPSQQVRKFFDENFPQVPIVELDGLGHDAFEEGKETFCDTVERLVDDHWQQ